MLAVDPERRYTMNQIKKHRWMTADGQTKPILPYGSERLSPCPEYSEQVLDLMEKQIKLDRNKTIEVSVRSLMTGHRCCPLAQRSQGLLAIVWWPAVY